MKNKFFVLGMLATALAFGFVFVGCDNGTSPAGDTFVAITGIIDTPTIAIKDIPLSLSGTVVPSNATNRTIVWSGEDVSGGKLTATSSGTVTVTATIANGASESSPYTKTFNITVYDAGNASDPNPFGDNTTPFYWGKENSGGIYVKVTDDSWEFLESDGIVGDSGTYERIGGIAAQWKVTGGTGKGDTGIAVIESGQILVRNLTNEYSGANGTYTKLDTTLTLTGTWKTSEASYRGNYMKIVASSDNFTVSVSPDDSTWAELIKGTYPASTNPATCTITQVNLAAFGGADTWVAWNVLDQQYKDMVGGSDTPTIVVYSDKCEGMGLVFQRP